MLDKIKELLKALNEKGIYIPLIADPKTGRGSVSLTLVFISFNLCVAGIIGKWSGFLGGVDPQNALNLFMVCAGLYFGRKLSKDPKGNLAVEESSNKDSEQK